MGLTGGNTSGKSTVPRRFNKKHKLPTIDVDQIARNI